MDSVFERISTHDGNGALDFADQRHVFRFATLVGSFDRLRRLEDLDPTQIARSMADAEQQAFLEGDDISADFFPIPANYTPDAVERHEYIHTAEHFVKAALGRRYAHAAAVAFANSYPLAERVSWSSDYVNGLHLRS